MNDALVSTGMLTDVTTGSSGFRNAKLDTINFPELAAVPARSGDVVSITASVRNTCAQGGHNSGTARLWFNGAPIDTGSAPEPGSRFDAIVDGTGNAYFLRPKFTLSGTAGSSPTFIDVAVGAKCSAFKPFGTWSVRLP